MLSDISENISALLYDALNRFGPSYLILWLMENRDADVTVIACLCVPLVSWQSNTTRP